MDDDEDGEQITEQMEVETEREQDQPSTQHQIKDEALILDLASKGDSIPNTGQQILSEGEIAPEVDDIDMDAEGPFQTSTP